MKDFFCGSLKGIVAILLSFLWLIGFSGLAYADEKARHGSKTFRCENDLVSLGDTMADVILRCGEPTYRHATGSRGKARTVKRKSTGDSEDGQDNKNHSGKKKRAASKTEYEEQVTETWYYNRGPNDFVYSLTFEGGTLKKIVPGKRGK